MSASEDRARDEGERLEHGVVQVRGDVGPLGLARPGGALVAELAHEPQPPRGEDDRDAREHRDRGHRGAHDLGGPRVLSHEQHDADEDEHDAARDAHDPGGRAPARPREQPAPLDGVELAPRERRARERDEHGDDPGDLDVDARAQRHEQRGAAQEDDADRDVAHGQAPHVPLEARREPGQRGGALLVARGQQVAGRDGEPPEHVQRDARAAREREERHDEAHDPDADAEVRREARAHATHPPAALGAAQRQVARSGRRAGLLSLSPPLDRHTARTPRAPPGGETRVGPRTVQGRVRVAPDTGGAPRAPAWWS